MNAHSWSAANIGDKSTVFKTNPVETSTSYRTAQPFTPILQVEAANVAMPTQRWLPCHANAPACFNSSRVFCKAPVVVVRNIYEVQSQGSEYQMVVPSTATPLAESVNRWALL